MYLAVDIGGTKTLLAVFDAGGNIIQQKKFPTNVAYDQFLLDLEKNVAEISTSKPLAVAVAVPGRLDRQAGVAISLGNLPWRNKTIRDDISKIIGSEQVIIENDAKTAGLAESQHLKNKYRKVVYMTISTGIGVASILDCQIPEAVEDIEIGLVPLYYEGKLMPWEDFASGKAIFETYGKKASEINDKETWHEIGLKIAYGTAIACGAFQPQAIVYGGGAGKYAANFIDTIAEYLRTNLHSDIAQPEELLSAHYPDDSVIRGCFILLQQKGLINGSSN